MQPVFTSRAQIVCFKCSIDLMIVYQEDLEVVTIVSETLSFLFVVGVGVIHLTVESFVKQTEEAG